MTSSGSSAAADLRAALDAFRRVIQALRQSSRDTERRLGLSAAQLFALQQLARHSGASITELAASTFTHQSSVSVVVQRLVARKLVAKLPAQDDRRRVRLALTDAGRLLLRRSPEPLQGRLIARIAGLSPEQREAFVAALNAISDTMPVRSGPPPMLFEEKPLRRTPGAQSARRRPVRGRRPRSMKASD